MNDNTLNLFNKIKHKDLSSHIVEFLHQYEHIELYFISNKIRQIVHLSKNFMIIFKFLLKLKNESQYLNIYNDESLIDLTYLKFYLFNKDDVTQALSSYFNYICYNNKTENKTFLLDIKQESDVFYWKDIIPMIKYNKAKFYLKESNIHLMNSEINSILKEIKYVNLSLNDKNLLFFKNLYENKIELFFEILSNNIFNFKEPMKYALEYFKEYPNHLSTIDMNNFGFGKIYDDEQLCQLIDYNNQSIKIIKLPYFPKTDRFFNILKKCENLIELKLSGQSDYFTNKNISSSFAHLTKLNSLRTNNKELLEMLSYKNHFNNLKEIGGFKIDIKDIETFTNILNKINNLESIINFELSFNNEKFVKKFFDCLNIRKLQKIAIKFPILYDDISIVLKNLIPYKKLKFFSLTYINLNCKCFEIENIFKIVDFNQNLNPDKFISNFEFIKDLMKRNSTGLYNITSNGNILITKFVNYLFLSNEFDLLKKINNLTINTGDNSHIKLTKFLNDINKLNITKSSQITIFKDIERINTIELNTIDNNENFFKFIKDKKIKVIKVLSDDKMELLKFIADNYKCLQFINYIKIINSVYKITDFDLNFIKKLKKLKNLFFLGLIVDKKIIISVNELLILKTETKKNKEKTD